MGYQYYGLLPPLLASTAEQ